MLAQELSKNLCPLSSACSRTTPAYGNPNLPLRSLHFSSLSAELSDPYQMEVPGCAPSIKPKVEPCEESSLPPPLPPFEASDDWEVTPLSGDNPFFTSVMCKSQVQQPFQQVIPVRFHRHLPEVRAPAVLLCRGRSWTVSYCGVGKYRRLQGAWRDFACDNGLRVGDACVFELVVPSTAAAGTEAAAAATERDGNDSSKEGKSMEVVFRVQVLRGGLPEEITSRGATSDDPLVIMD